MRERVKRIKKERKKHSLDTRKTSEHYGLPSFLSECVPNFGTKFLLSWG
ncbi:hypothetical protein HanHA300_Chr17g0647461 [Helianthus annuus]|nr:hypothetical protein HanHA300_Chr17g0647461 [Helianthus annuus]KAJ0446896.1 hypothetical protein HanHA89_Chr17g0699351 [Helianthus annuus]KAJ0631790.1 hypothetical protein HanLR1_Chr17g0657901 [Helianthus annuus]KAJ0635698.1 hypothetical protein HanOQP8_Chr17g0653751 [Helianthus annuus]